MLVKENQWRLIAALIVSLLFNFSFLVSALYHAWEHREVSLSFTMKEPLIVGISKENGPEVLSDFLSMPYGQLLSELHSKECMNHGFRRRDFALACLVEHHHLPIESILRKDLIQRRRISAKERGGGGLELTLFSGLLDEHYEAILAFLKQEVMPFSAEGMFLELKRLGEDSPTELREAFYATSEFQRIERLFRKAHLPSTKEEILRSVLMGEYELFSSAHSLKTFFLSLPRRADSNMGSLLFFLERDLVSLSDEEVLYAVETADPKLPWVQEGLRQLLETPRSRQVKEKVIEKRANNSQRKTYRRHKVAPGETLWYIAKLHQTSVDKLNEMNGLESAQVLQVGKELLVPSSSQEG